MKRVASFLALVAALGATACGDSPLTSPGLSPGQPTNVLLDGSQLGGNKDFFFLPPLAPNPTTSPNFSAGKFNPTLQPIVDICLLKDENTDPAVVSVPVEATPCDGDPIRTIAKSELRVSDEMYHVVWHTGEDDLSPDRYYRIKVRTGTFSLGFADVTVADNRLEARSAITNEVFPLNADRSLPIKFRIEQGAFGACDTSTADCTEVSVPPTGGVFYTNTGHAAVKFVSGFASEAAVEAGGGNILLTIERVPENGDPNCHADQGRKRIYKEQRGCYHYATFPDLDEDPDGDGPKTSFGGFQTEGNKVFQCSTGLGDSSDEDYLLFKSDEGKPLQWLGEVKDPDVVLNCDNFAFYDGLPANRVLRFATLGWRHTKRVVGRAVSVKIAYAYDGGLGGLLLGGDGFSFISRGKATTRVAVAGTSHQSAVVGDKVPINPTIRLVSLHPHKDDVEAHLDDVDGQEVVFRALNGGTLVDPSDPSGARASQLTVLTKSGGYASVEWYPGAGENTLLVEFGEGVVDVIDAERKQVALAAPLTFTASGIAGSIVARVQDINTSAPIAGATTRLFSGSGEGRTLVGTRVSGADGSVTFDGLAPGVYSSETTGPTGWGQNVAPSLTVTAGQVLRPFFLLVPTGAVSGLVTNAATGAAITQATVTVAGGPVAGFTKSAQTNEFGSYFIPGLSAGTYSVTAEATGYATAVQSGVLVGATVVPVNISLRAAVAEIRVSGFTSPRSTFPLLGPTGEPLSGPLGASQLVADLRDETKFGASGVVSCRIAFRPFVTTVEPGSLLDAAGSRRVDVFFGSVLASNLSPAEATELAAFVRAGGILYVGNNTAPENGPVYASLFSALGIGDAYSSSTLTSDISSGQSSDPPDTAPFFTNGPFGTVGSLDHTGFRPIIASSMTPLARGNNVADVLVAEGVGESFGAGRIAATGDPLHEDLLTDDLDNRKYFLNLFAAGCQIIN